MISAVNAWVLAYDNISRLTPWLSDGLCRLATGAGLTTRELYTNAEEVTLAAERPVILNGIEELATRPDLLDRAIVLNLPNISEVRRRTESSFWRQFEQEKPRILGALFMAASTALRRVGDITLKSTPRMADFVAWVSAAEPSLGWSQGKFLQAYRDNAKAAIDFALESSVVGIAVLDLVGREAGLPADMADFGFSDDRAGLIYHGTATALLDKLQGDTSESKRQRGWPLSSGGLSNILRRLAPALRTRGIDIEFLREGHDRQRTIRISVAVGNSVRAVRESPAEEKADDADDPDGGLSKEILAEFGL
jgi:hypothetical protein